MSAPRTRARPTPAVRYYPGPENAPTGQPGAFSGLSFTVQGDPVPKERPRVVKGRTYTPARTLCAEAIIAGQARIAGARPHTHPVHVVARFFRASARRCDLDNLLKTVLDGLNRVAFKDDDQVVLITASKLIDRDNPRTEIELRGIPSPCIWDQA